MPVKSVDYFSITDNGLLLDIKLEFASIRQHFVVGGNHQIVDVGLSNLSCANNTTFQCLSSVQIPILNYVNDSFSISDSIVQMLRCLELRSVEWTMSLRSNYNLTIIDMPLDAIERLMII